MKLKHLILLSVICCSQSVFGQKANQQPKTSGNPVFPGWYADPEGIVFGDEYWIYPTYSAPYDEQTFMDAFSSKDLVNWTKHPKVLSKENISWFKGSSSNLVVISFLFQLSSSFLILLKVVDMFAF